MNLRTRLVVSILVTVIPFTVAMAFWQLSNHRQTTYENMARNALSMVNRSSQLCNRNPAGWPHGPRGPRGPQGQDAAPPAEFFAYGSDYVSFHPRAPKLEATLLKSMQNGQAYAGTQLERLGEKRNAVLVRTPWPQQACAYILITVSAPVKDAGQTRALGSGLASGLLAALVAWLAVAPVVSRIRVLQESVKREETTVLALEGNDEIAQLGRAFAQAQSEIAARLQERKDIEETLRDYITHTSHDILTPLTVLQGHLANVQSGADSQVAMTHAIESCEHIGALVNNLSAVAKLEAAQAPSEIAPTSLNNALERVCSRYAPFAKLRNVDLNYSLPEEDVIVNGDLVLIERALGNVIHNAIRYNRSGGHIAVLLRITSDGFCVQVLDDGPGVPEIEIARLCDKSFTGEGGKTSGGSGIGLYVVQNVIERHQWHIAFSNSQPCGLNVEFSGSTLVPT